MYNGTAMTTWHDDTSSETLTASSLSPKQRVSAAERTDAVPVAAAVETVSTPSAEPKASDAAAWLALSAESGSGSDTDGSAEKDYEWPDSDEEEEEEEETAATMESDEAEAAEIGASTATAHEPTLREAAPRRALPQPVAPTRAQARHRAEAVRAAIALLQPHWSKAPDALARHFASARGVGALLSCLTAAQCAKTSTMAARSPQCDAFLFDAAPLSTLTLAKAAIGAAFPMQRTPASPSTEFSEAMGAHAKAVVRYAVAQYRVSPDMKQGAIDDLDASADAMAAFLVAEGLTGDRTEAEVRGEFVAHNRVVLERIEATLDGRRRIVAPDLARYYSTAARGIGTGSCDDPAVNGDAPFIGAEVPVDAAALSNAAIARLLGAAVGDETARTLWARHTRLEEAAVATLVRSGESPAFDEARDAYVADAVRGVAAVDAQGSAWAQEHIALRDERLYPEVSELGDDGDADRRVRRDVEVFHYHTHHHHEVECEREDDVYADECDEYGGDEDDAVAACEACESESALCTSLAQLAVAASADEPDEPVFDAEPLQSALQSFVDAQRGEPEQAVLAAALATGAALLGKLDVRDGEATGDVLVLATLLTAAYEALGVEMQVSGQIGVLRHVAGELADTHAQANLALASASAPLQASASVCTNRHRRNMEKMRADFMAARAELSPSGSAGAAQLDRVGAELVAQLQTAVYNGPWARSESGKLREVRRYAPYYVPRYAAQISARTLSVVLGGLVSSVVVALPHLSLLDRALIVEEWGEAATRAGRLAQRATGAGFTSTATATASARAT